MVNSILFVCTGNTCRSVMAEYLLRHYASEAGLDLKINSAGLQAYVGDLASEQTVAVLAELGIDASKHRSRQVSSYLLAEYDLVLAMTSWHQQALEQLSPELTQKFYLLKEFVQTKLATKEDLEDLIEKDYEISDPFGQSLVVYRQSREEIKQEILALVDLWTKGEG